MPILKCKKDELVVGEFYLTYSSKSKNLARNGKGGVIVQYVGKTAKGDNTFKIPLANGTFFDMHLTNLDTRKDAFVVKLDKNNTDQIKFAIGDEGAFNPKFGPKTRERAANGVEIKYSSIMNPEARYPEESQDGTPTLVFTIEGVDRPVYLNNYQVNVTTNVLELVCTYDELEAKRIAEERAKIEKLREGGVRLAVGKMELGQKCLPDLLDLRKKFIARSNIHSSYNCSYSVLYGDVETGEVGSQYNYYNAPCHASICETRDVDIKVRHKRLYILSSVIKDYCSGKSIKHNTEAIRAWVSFMVNDSVYADLFVDKDVNAILKYGYVVNCDAPSNAVASALMATRSIYEYGQRGLAFHKLSQHLPPNLAYFVAQHATGVVDNKGELTSLTFTNSTSGHSPLNHVSMSVECIVRLTLGYVDTTRVNRSLQEVNDYQSPHAAHDFLGKRGSKSDLTSSLQSIVLKKAERDKPKNVFDIPKTDVDVAIKAAVEVAKKWMSSYGI